MCASRSDASVASVHQTGRSLTIHQTLESEGNKIEEKAEYALEQI